MKNLIILFALFFTIKLSAQYGFDHYLNSTVVDTNNILGFFNNYGSTQSENGITGLFWDQLNSDDKTIVYDQGLWVVGKISGIPKLSINQWRSTYSPGPIINGQSAMLIHPEDSLRYRIYKINKGDDISNPDFTEWPRNFGAPVNIDNTPKIYGDQTHWCVYNGLDSTISGRTSFIGNDTIHSMPIEVQQLVYLRKGNLSDYLDVFSNTIFMEYIIINKGLENIDSTFIGFWTDIDFRSSLNTIVNLPGVDSINQAGYCWSDFNIDIVPPAVGYTLLYGPVEESIGSTAIYKGSILENYKNLPLHSFHGIADDGSQNPLTQTAWNTEDAWNFANGLDADGNVIINPVTNQPTRFPFDGDPVTDSGWLFSPQMIGGGAGFVFFTGPFNLAPNDTQWVMIALIPALGRNNLESVELLREKAQLLHSLPYDSLAFGTINYFITDANENNILLPTEFSLSQNYPNPFNPSTSIQYAISSRQLVQLKVYDILGSEVATLVNQEQSVGNYKVDFNASHLSSGVYFYQIKAGEFIQSKKMILIK
ncbi:MAG: T9SS type A sorting domain-containing protein [Ignavibacteriaceae bacterium]